MLTDSLQDRMRNQFMDVAGKCEGAIALFIERPTATLVRVSDIVTDEWGVKAKITCVQAPGIDLFSQKRSEQVKLSAAWEIFGSDEKEWYARYVSWRLLFDATLIEEITAHGVEAAKSDKLLEYNDISRFVRKYDALPR